MDERRGAQRLAVPKPVPCTFGGFDAKITEVSEIGCLITHTDRVTPKARLPLKFKWRGTEVRIEGTLARSEMRAVGGKPTYVSGIEFCRTPEEAPPVMKEIVGWLAKTRALETPTPPAGGLKPTAPPAAPPPEDEVETLAANYLQCVFTAGQWMKLYVDDAAQPANGFTIPAPSNDAEADVLCRAYEKADAARRKAMRAQFELAIKQQQRRA